jgi:hypothetical protein
VAGRDEAAGGSALHISILVFLAWSLFCAASDAGARGPRLAALEEIRRQGLRRAMFVLEQPTRVEILAEGAGDRDGNSFLAQGWILDLQSRRPVWVQEDADNRFDRDSDNWRAEESVELPAGTYGVFYAAFNGFLPVDARLKILGLTIGGLQSRFGRMHDWDDFGDPDRWGIWVHAADPNLKPAPVPAQAPEPYRDAVVREIGLRDGEYRQVQLDLDSDVEFYLRATGENARGSDVFADDAWIVDRSTWERAWKLERSRTAPAGGAAKNRLFEERVRLSRGSYLITVATDQTHATGSWNAMPPWDPDSWGLVMQVVDPQDRGAVHVSDSERVHTPVLEITEARNNFFRREPFYTTEPTRVRVRALGEQDRSGRAFADFGWIERQDDLQTVWTMDAARTYPAGGASKNRLVEEAIDLAPGSYSLCYATDDSHAYDDWNQEPPYSPSSWGIALFEIDGNASIRRGKNPDLNITSISLAPVGSDEHQRKRFETSERTRVRLIALGEGVNGEMADYGWLERAATREVVWEMRYPDTQRAGGARKNREVRVILELPPDVYELHYVTDGSHAFEDWNDDPPAQPHLWGITLIEQE